MGTQLAPTPASSNIYNKSTPQNKCFRTTMMGLANPTRFLQQRSASMTQVLQLNIRVSLTGVPVHTSVKPKITMRTPHPVLSHSPSLSATVFLRGTRSENKHKISS